MAERDPRGVGERIVGWCLGALACSIALTVTVELLRAIWPELLAGLLVVAVVLGGWWFYTLRSRW